MTVHHRRGHDERLWRCPTSYRAHPRADWSGRARM